MRQLFGTDGIRGVAGDYPLDPTTIHRLGRGLVRMGFNNLVIGRDTRASGTWIEAVLRESVERAGGRATAAGVITTPGLSFLCRSADFDAGVMISASHNPYTDNGLKIFQSAGLKFSDAQEHALESILFDLEELHPQSAVRDAGTGDFEQRHGEWVDGYVHFLQSVSPNGVLQGLRVVLDCANGAAFQIAGEAFEALGCHVTLLNHEPDGSNINRNCGALHPQTLAETVRREKAQVGMAFDGDADRVILADERGRVIDGDYILYVLGKRLSREGRLPTHCIVTTVMANVGLELALKNQGIATLRTRVGDRFVLEAMLEGGHQLGGEQSGHTILRSLSPAGDGIQTGLKIAETMALEQRSLSELCRGLEKFPQVLINVRVRSKEDFSLIPEIQGEIDSTMRALGEKGRVVIRYSGTEPLARVMIEGEEQETINAYAQSIADVFRRKLGEGER